MRSRDFDPFFTLDIPVLRIRRCTSAEAAARAERWARSRAMKIAPVRAEDERRSGKQAAAATGGNAAPEPLPPWHEVAAAWQRVRATFDGLFQSDEEEEQMRVAIHQGGARWRTFLTPSMSESATDVDR